MLGELLAAVSNCKKRARGYSPQSIQEDEQLLWATASQDHFLYTAPQLMWLPSNLVRTGGFNGSA